MSPFGMMASLLMLPDTAFQRLSLTFLWLFCKQPKCSECHGFLYLPEVIAKVLLAYFQSATGLMCLPLGIGFMLVTLFVAEIEDVWQL